MVENRNEHKDPIIRDRSLRRAGKLARGRKAQTWWWVFCMRTRKQQIEFHVKSDDYFGTLAAKIDLAKQTLEKNSGQAILKKQQIKTLGKLKKDLVFLQRNYQIIKK